MAALTSAVSRNELMRHLHAVTSMVRLSGSPEESQAFDYIENHLAALGYQVARYESQALIGYPRHAELRVLNGQPLTVEANGYSLSPSTGSKGVTGELVYAGAGRPDDLVDIDVEGKIVVSDGLATPAKTRAASEAGAIGQIHINDHLIHEMCISQVWGAPVPENLHLLPTLPSVAVVREDGDRLLKRLRSGPVTVTLITEPYRQWTTIPTLVAELPGSREEDYVLFSGHVDSWHFGAMDNGTANATQLEVARLLAERRRHLRRGIRIAFWSGHSHGRYAGSTWYADTFWHDLYSRCVCHVNIDSVGAVGATVRDEAPTMAETFRLGKEILHATTGTDLRYRRIGRASDQSFWGHGIPSLFAEMSEQPPGESAAGAVVAEILGAGPGSGGLGWWWHTVEDSLDKIDPDNLVVDCSIYVEALWRLCTDERLPIDPAAGADEIAEAVAAYDVAAGSSVDLSSLVDLATDVSHVIRERTYATIESQNANRMIKAVNRALIPVNYTRSGPFGHDLALRSRPVPGLSDAGDLAKLPSTSDEFHALRTRIQRERNRVERALRQAVEVCTV